MATELLSGKACIEGRYADPCSGLLLVGIGCLQKEPWTGQLCCITSSPRAQELAMNLVHVTNEQAVAACSWLWLSLCPESSQLRSRPKTATPQGEPGALQSRKDRALKKQWHVSLLPRDHTPGQKQGPGQAHVRGQGGTVLPQREAGLGVGIKMHRVRARPCLA